MWFARGSYFEDKVTGWMMWSEVVGWWVSSVDVSQLSWILWWKLKNLNC
jgi:hypothetical protein